MIDEPEHSPEAVRDTVNLCAEQIKELEQFATDHYDAGGHWVAETYDAQDYAYVLLNLDGDVDAAKEYLRRDWERMNMLEREYAYGDEE